MSAAVVWMYNNDTVTSPEGPAMMESIVLRVAWIASRSNAVVNLVAF